MLSRQEGYALRKIKGIDYLMPYGQKIADQRKGMVLNETGSFLWHFLEQPKEREEILEAVIQYYEVKKSERSEVETQVSEFIDQLLALGVLKDELRPLGESLWGTLGIGNLRVGLYGKKEFFSEKFRPFSEEPSYGNMSERTLEQKIEVLYGTAPFRANGKRLLKNRELEVFEMEDLYELYFPTMSEIQSVYITKNAEYVRIYCIPSAYQGTAPMKENLFHAIRHIFLLYAQKNGYYAIHSASILYQGKAWLFSGHSGMGKSTHTALWHKNVETPYLNGDLNLIGKSRDGEGYCIYGIPWCGTSELCTTDEVPLGGIILLGRDRTDHVEELTPFEQVLRVTQRMISPSWTEAMEDKNLEFAEQLTDQIWISHLFCTPEPSAVDVIRTWIDEKMKSSGNRNGRKES